MRCTHPPTDADESSPSLSHSHVFPSGIYPRTFESRRWIFREIPTELEVIFDAAFPRFHATFVVKFARFGYITGVFSRPFLVLLIVQ